MIRGAETSADVEAHSACWSAVWPEDVVSVDFVLDRMAREPERLYLNALDGDRVIGTGFVGRSSRPGFRPVAVTVLPEWRGRGLGGTLLDRCLEYARSLGGVTALGTVREDEGGVADIPTGEPLSAPSFADWVTEIEQDLLAVIALDGDSVVGFANLEMRNAPLGVLGNGLTTVVQSHRGRGIAEALKRAEVAWAAGGGFRQITTSTHEANDAMWRVNEKLGYRPRPALLVSRPLGP